MALTELKLKALKNTPEPGKHADKDGLFLRVDKKGRMYWQWRIRVGGSETLVSYGSYPATGLAQARELHAVAKQQRKAGVNPNVAKKAAKASEQNDATNSFEMVAREWFELKRGEWSADYGERVMRRLEADIFPWLGKESVEKITPRLLLEVLRRMESRGVLETTHRALETCRLVFSYAVATDKAERNPASELKDVLRKPDEKHLPAITDPVRLGELLRACDSYKGTHIVRAALHLLPILFVRPGELRHARWEEFDLDNSIWTIPAERMKRKKAGKLFGNPHIVSLPTQAVATLLELKSLTGESDFVFRGERHHDRPMSDAAINAALRAMGFTNEEVTSHGFRATARTMLAERLDVDENLIEAQLAHSVKDSLGRAYNRTQFLDQRKGMLQLWADYLDQLRKGADVVPMNAQGNKVA